MQRWSESPGSYFTWFGCPGTLNLSAGIVLESSSRSGHEPPLTGVVPLVTVPDSGDIGVVSLCMGIRCPEHGSYAACKFSSGGPMTFFCEPVLVFIKAFHLKGDDSAPKHATLSHYSTTLFFSAKKFLWEHCSEEILFFELPFTTLQRSSEMCVTSSCIF